MICVERFDRWERLKVKKSEVVAMPIWGLAPFFENASRTRSHQDIQFLHLHSSCFKFDSKKEI